MKINTISVLSFKSNAWKFRALLIFFIFKTISAQSQDTITVANHLIDTPVKNQIFKYPITFTNQNIKDFTFTEVKYEYQKNQFARTQIANEINTYQFLAQGYYTTKSKWQLFGNLAIRKINEKDLGWVLSDDRSEEQEVIAPHYFLVPRKGNWNNQQYRLNGGFSKEITNRISVSAKMNYNAEKYARNIDPRPQIIVRQIGGEVQLGYQIAQSHKGFIFGGYTQKDKDYSYMYKNTQLNVESYPDTYLRFNAGYGRIINFLRSSYGASTFHYKDSHIKTGLGYNFSNKNNIFTALYYNKKENNNLYNSVYTTTEDEKYKFETKGNHIELFAFNRWEDKQLKTTFKYDQSNASNYDVKSRGINFKNSLNSINLQTSFSKRTNTFITYLLGLDLIYQKNKYNDILATSTIELNSLNTGIYASKEFAFKKSKINATINLNLYLPLPSQLNYYDTSGGTNSRFFNEVIIHDYVISTTNYFAPSYRLEYCYTMKKNKTVVLFTNFREKIALKKQTTDYTNINTKNTYWIQMGVQLNY